VSSLCLYSDFFTHTWTLFKVTATPEFPFLWFQLLNWKWIDLSEILVLFYILQFLIGLKKSYPMIFNGCHKTKQIVLIYTHAVNNYSVLSLFWTPYNLGICLHWAILGSRNCFTSFNMYTTLYNMVRSILGTFIFHSWILLMY
jgi:hypothetical protein